MSAPSRPQRRIKLTIPTGLVPLAASADDTAAPAEVADGGAPAAPVAEPAPAAPPDLPQAGMLPIRGPGKSRRHLALTMPTVAAPGAVAPPEAPAAGPLAGTPAVAPPSAAAPTGAVPPIVPPPKRVMAEPEGRPHRRLRLTLPTGLGFGGPGSLDGPPLPNRVEATYYLREEIVGRLEEEWWRRQSLGENWSRADIVQAALDDALADPERLGQALRRTSEKGGT